MRKMNGQMLRELYINGSNQLYNNYQKANALNVFPVPDGDTGTNMIMTVDAGIKAMVNSEDVYEVAKSFAKGCLMGARGNSGVITSQIFKGFANGLEGCKELDMDALKRAFVEAKKTAYASVSTPVEGTILTVVRKIAEYTPQFTGGGPGEYLRYVIKVGCAAVEKTPEQLPVLKEAGVVDAGGFGFMEFMVGVYQRFGGKKVERLDLSDEVEIQQEFVDNHEDHEYGYCTEFVVVMHKEGQEEVAKLNMMEELEKFGDSVASVVDEDILKIHVHTLTPEDAMKFAHQFGEFHTIKIENMQEQVTARFNEDPKEIALIAVSPAQGIDYAFKGSNVDYVIGGGQSANPSTEEISNAIKRVNAKNVIILPNNSNIFMAANQAAEIADCNVTVIKSRTVPQGLAAASVYAPTMPVEENVEEMKDIIQEVSTLEITIAEKDTTFDGIEIAKGEFIAIKNGKIVASEKTDLKAIKAALATFDDYDMATIIFGKDAKNKETVKELFTDKHVEVDVINGGQEIYHYIIGVE